MVWWRTRPASAQVSVVEDWEDTNPLSEWSGSTGDYTVQSTTVHGGSNALEASSAGAGRIESDPGDGLANYPDTGDTFEYWIYVGGNNWFYTQFNFQASGTAWMIFHNADADLLDLREDGGSTTIDRQDPLNWNTNEWHRMEVQWVSDSDVTVIAHDNTDTELGRVSGNPSSTPNSNGIAIGPNNNSNSWYHDEWVIL